eukprot:5493575-Prymnesium_polylepis.1
MLYDVLNARMHASTPQQLRGKDDQEGIEGGGGRNRPAARTHTAQTARPAWSHTARAQCRAVPVAPAAPEKRRRAQAHRDPHHARPLPARGAHRHGGFVVEHPQEGRLHLGHAAK